MPITKSAQKALRQSKTRRERNIKKKESYKKVLKQIKSLLTESKKDDALKLVSRAYKALDKAAKTGVIKKNTAGRKKSRLMKSLKVSK